MKTILLILALSSTAVTVGDNGLTTFFYDDHVMGIAVPKNKTTRYGDGGDEKIYLPRVVCQEIYRVMKDDFEKNGEAK